MVKNFKILNLFYFLFFIVSHSFSQTTEESKIGFLLNAGLNYRTIPFYSNNIPIDPLVLPDQAYIGALDMNTTIKGVGVYVGLGLRFKKINLSVNYNLGIRYSLFYNEMQKIDTNQGVITRPVKTLITEHQLFVEKLWGKKDLKGLNSFGISFMNEGTEFGSLSDFNGQKGYAGGNNLKFTALWLGGGISYRNLKFELRGYYAPNVPYLALSEKPNAALIPEINVSYSFGFPFPKIK